MAFDNLKNTTAGFVAAGAMAAGTHEVYGQALKVGAAVHFDIAPIVIPAPEVQAHFKFQTTTVADPGSFIRGAIMVPADAPRIVDTPGGKFYESDATVVGPGGVAIGQLNFFVIAPNGTVGSKILQNDVVPGPNGTALVLRRNWFNPADGTLWQRDLMDGPVMVERQLFRPFGTARELLGADGQTTVKKFAYAASGALYPPFCIGLMPGEVPPPPPSASDPLVIPAPAPACPPNTLYYQDGDRYLPITADIQVPPDRCFTRSASGGFVEFSAGANMGFNFSGGFVVAAPPMPGVAVDVHLGDFFNNHPHEREQNVQIIKKVVVHEEDKPREVSPPAEKKHADVVLPAPPTMPRDLIKKKSELPAHDKSTNAPRR